MAPIIVCTERISMLLTSTAGTRSMYFSLSSGDPAGAGRGPPVVTFLCLWLR